MAYCCGTLGDGKMLYYDINLTTLLALVMLTRSSPPKVGVSPPT